jgi:hypothetical protein
MTVPTTTARTGRRGDRLMRLTVAGVALVLSVLGAAPARAQAGTGSIVVSFWNDDLGNGVRDPRDTVNPGLCFASLDVTPDGSSGRTIDTQDGPHTLTFDGVTPGRHEVRGNCLHGSNGHPPGGPGDTVATTPGTVGVDVPDATQVQVSFGEFIPVDMYGQVFRDDNGDGVKQPAEPGIDGCTVTLDRSGSTTTDRYVGSSYYATDNGAFGFTVGPGRHHTDTTCPGLGPPTSRPADVVAHSGQQIGTPLLAGLPADPSPLAFGFGPASATTTRPRTSTTATAGSTSTTSVATSSTPGSSTTATVKGTKASSSNGGHGPAVGAGIGAIAVVAAAIVLVIRRRPNPTIPGPD